MKDKIIITSDWHIIESEIEEVDKILDEIYFKSGLKANKTIILGDVLDKYRPSNPPTATELEYLSYIFSKLTKEMKVILIVGNHERITKEKSYVNFLKFLGVEIYDEQYIENNKLFGHFYLKESKFGFNAEKTIKDLKYDLVLLGHQHDFQKLGENVYHLGSIRYVTFKEDTQTKKYFAYLEGDKIEFLPIKSCYKMYKLSANKTIFNRLKKLSPNSKVAVKINDFEFLKNNLEKLEEFRKKFKKFSIVKETPNQILENFKKIEISKLSVKDFFKSWLRSRKLDPEIKKLLIEVIYDN